MKNSVACVLIIMGTLLLPWPVVVMLLRPLASSPSPDPWENMVLGLSGLVGFALGLLMVGLAISYFLRQPPQ